MSLSVLNSGRGDLPERYRRGDGRRLGPGAGRHRGRAEVRQPGGAAGLYTALGTRIHHEKAGLGRDTVDAALAEAGLPVELADAMDSTEYDEALQASHHAGMDPVGYDVGTPVIHVDGDRVLRAGAVPDPARRGGRRGSSTAPGSLAGYPHFYELKRTRTEGPRFD